MAAPEGYTELGRIGFVDKGNYASGTTYRTGDVVYYNGSTWVALKDNLRGVTPAPGANWKYMARGFAAEALSAITAVDTSGVLREAGASVTSQELIDAIADKVMTKLIEKSKIVNNLLATDATTVLSGPMGKSLDDKITQLNSKMPTDLTYITSVMPRIKDIIGIEGQSYQLLSDVAYAISVKGIKSGGFGFNNQLYSDRPVNTSNWGYVEYFQHADNYVTVKLYPESSLDIFIRRFTINTMTWNTDWRKLSTTDVVN